MITNEWKLETDILISSRIVSACCEFQFSNFIFNYLINCYADNGAIVPSSAVWECTNKIRCRKKANRRADLNFRSIILSVAAANQTALFTNNIIWYSGFQVAGVKTMIFGLDKE